MNNPLDLFEAVGIELEYMIVAQDTLSVMPVADKVLTAKAGKLVSDLEDGSVGWSNELVLHVIELKTNGPAASFDGLAEAFHRHISEINHLLSPMGGRLMPTACHPWMDPLTETVLWPHEYSPIYEAYDRIFSCQGHGWSNLQSMHINLPFNGDEEFGRLHAAIRLLLPIMPALTAASPILDGKTTGFMDGRMEVYRHNSEKIPSIAGLIIPEPVYDRRTYERDIFQRMYADIAPFDPDNVLQDEFLNSRGAIARFERGSIEIRILDIQETPLADVAVAALITAVLKQLCQTQGSALATMQQIGTDQLAGIFLDTIRRAETAVIDNEDYASLLGLKMALPTTVGRFWRALFKKAVAEGAIPDHLQQPLEVILNKGCLSRRILAATGPDPDHEDLKRVYGELCQCLADGTMFSG